MEKSRNTSFHKAVVTAASPAESHLPLQTLVDPEGVSRPALEILLDDLFAAGLESAAVVIQPGTREAYLRAAGPHAGRLTLIEQTEPRGYGHAVWTARDYTGDDPFVLLVGDHLFLSRREESCVGQLLAVAEKHDGCVSGVQATHESQLHLYGTVGGRRVPSAPSVLEVATMVEKPTPTLAEQDLFISGLRAGNYYCFFGIHALTPAVMRRLDHEVAALADDGTLGLTPTLAAMARSEKYLAVEIDGQRFNIGERYGLLRAQLSLALAGPHRDEVLTLLIGITADSRP